VDNQQPIIIEHNARGPGGGVGRGPTNILRRRRWSISAGLALVEILYALIARPPWALATLLALIVLALAVVVIRRLRPGIIRDGLIIIAIAQAMVTLIPLAVTLSFALAIILAIVVIIGVAVFAFRLGA